MTTFYKHPCIDPRTGKWICDNKPAYNKFMYAPVKPSVRPERPGLRRSRAPFSRENPPRFNFTVPEEEDEPPRTPFSPENPPRFYFDVPDDEDAGPTPAFNFNLGNNLGNIPNNLSTPYRNSLEAFNRELAELRQEGINRVPANQDESGPSTPAPDVFYDAEAPNHRTTYSFPDGSWNPDTIMHRMFTTNSYGRNRAGIHTYLGRRDDDGNLTPEVDNELVPHPTSALVRNPGDANHQIGINLDAPYNSAQQIHNIESQAAEQRAEARRRRREATDTAADITNDIVNAAADTAERNAQDARNAEARANLVRRARRAASIAYDVGAFGVRTATAVGNAGLEQWNRINAPIPGGPQDPTQTGTIDNNPYTRPEREPDIIDLVSDGDEAEGPEMSAQDREDIMNEVLLDDPGLQRGDRARNRPDFLQP